MRRGFTKKRCPKCNGNVFVDQENHIDSEGGYRGWYEWCLQCGYTQDIKPATALMEKLKIYSSSQGAGYHMPLYLEILGPSG